MTAQRNGQRNPSSNAKSVAPPAAWLAFSEAPTQHRPDSSRTSIAAIWEARPTTPRHNLQATPPPSLCTKPSSPRVWIRASPRQPHTHKQITMHTHTHNNMRMHAHTLCGCDSAEVSRLVRKTSTTRRGHHPRSSNGLATCRRAEVWRSHGAHRRPMPHRKERKEGCTQSARHHSRRAAPTRCLMGRRRGAKRRTISAARGVPLPQCAPRAANVCVSLL